MKTFEEFRKESYSKLDEGVGSLIWNWGVKPTIKYQAGSRGYNKAMDATGNKGSVGGQLATGIGANFVPWGKIGKGLVGAGKNAVKAYMGWRMLR